MISSELASPTYSGELGDGLIRRWSTAADTERFAQLLGTVFRDQHDELPNPWPMAEARLMMQPAFPYMTATDVAVVEDTRHPERPLVACTTLWHHQWSLGGIPFGVGRPEMVAADPAYRNRGLVRGLFEMIHARSAAEGHLLQAITGIPYFYRQFGYDYLLDLEGGRTTYFSLIPTRKGDRPEPCSLRPATREDVPRIMALYAQRRSTSLIWHEAPERRWQFAIEAAGEPAVAQGEGIRAGVSWRYWMILDAEQDVCGYLSLVVRRWGPAISVRELTFAPRTDLPKLVPALLRQLRDMGQHTPAVRPDTPPCSAIALQLGRAHPIYDLLGDALAPRVEPPYAWYIRIPDLPAFVRRVAPVLERRLAQSILGGHTGGLKLDLYRGGLHLRFERGSLVGVESWRPPIHGDDDTALGCPPLTFLQLLLGYRSLDELRTIYPDVWVKDEHRLAIDTLFPKQQSFVEPLG